MEVPVLSVQVTKSLKINVGGTIFETTKDTLSNSDFFRQLFKFSKIDEASVIFVDRNPEAFKHVLEYLRDPRYDFPLNYMYELEYYMPPDNSLEKLNEKIFDFKNVYAVVKEINLSKELWKRGVCNQHSVCKLMRTSFDGSSSMFEIDDESYIISYIKDIIVDFHHYRGYYEYANEVVEFDSLEGNGFGEVFWKDFYRKVKIFLGGNIPYIGISLCWKFGEGNKPNKITPGFNVITSWIKDPTETCKRLPSQQNE